jgi:hypothetical protein
VCANDQPAFAATAGLIARATCYLGFSGTREGRREGGNHVVHAHAEEGLHRRAEVECDELCSEGAGAGRRGPLQDVLRFRLARVIVLGVGRGGGGRHGGYTCGVGGDLGGQ